MRSLDPSLRPEVVAGIERRLAGLARDHGVVVRWAVESGSRAWGFPSPDSDYDCRFIFVRPAADYLSPWRPADVIETPPGPVYDIAGWDLIKAVTLAVGGNATVGEWLRSPLVYDGDPGFCRQLQELVARVTDRPAVTRHYLHVGRRQWSRSGAQTGDARLKQVFYAVRPAVTVRWLDLHPSGISPMDLPTLLLESELPVKVEAAITDLIDQKARTREMGSGLVPSALGRFVADILGRPDPVSAGRDESAVRQEAADAFGQLVDRWAPAAVDSGP